VSRSPGIAIFFDLSLYLCELVSLLTFLSVSSYSRISLYPRSPKGEGVYCFTSVRLSVRPSVCPSILPSVRPSFVCPSVLPSVLPSFRPSKIFFVTFFSVTVDGRNPIFGHKHHIGIPYCG
jgi:hypothetical protein